MHPQPATPTRPSLAVTLEEYQQALETLNEDSQNLFPALLARDQVEEALQGAQSRHVEQVRQCVELDKQLRQQTASRALNELPLWRQTLHPPETAWWWFLDQKTKALEKEAQAGEKEKDLPWVLRVLLTAILLVVTATLTLEIIRRLWAGAPDTVSIFGTLLTLLLTGSPWFEWGQELAQWTLKGVPRLKPRYRAQAMAGMAGLALALILAVWFSLPSLARWYNNRGVEALQSSNLTTAQRRFQRAVALNPEQVVAYQNLADVYARIGRSEAAIAWYQKAIERDLNFGPAYDGLSQLYNEQGEFELAVQVALAGLRPGNTAKELEVALVAHYGLLSNLGRAYFEQRRYGLAQEALEAAVALEDELSKLKEARGELRRALPHYYLAQVYERQKLLEAAQEEWEDALRYLKEDNWADREWLAIVKERLTQP